MARHGNREVSFPIRACNLLHKSGLCASHWNLFKLFRRLWCLILPLGFSRRSTSKTRHQFNKEPETPNLQETWNPSSTSNLRRLINMQPETTQQQITCKRLSNKQPETPHQQANWDVSSVINNQQERQPASNKFWHPSNQQRATEGILIAKNSGHPTNKQHKAPNQQATWDIKLKRNFGHPTNNKPIASNQQVTWDAHSKQKPDKPYRPDHQMIRQHVQATWVGCLQQAIHSIQLTSNLRHNIPGQS